MKEDLSKMKFTATPGLFAKHNGKAIPGIYKAKIEQASVGVFKYKKVSTLCIFFYVEKLNAIVIKYYPLTGYKKDSTGNDILGKDEKRIEEPTKTIFARTLAKKVIRDAGVDASKIDLDSAGKKNLMIGKYIGICLAESDFIKEGKKTKTIIVEYTFPEENLSIDDETQQKLKLIEKLFTLFLENTSEEIIKADKYWHNDLFNDLYDMTYTELKQFVTKHKIEI
jgi:hypothetical protein